ncbi:MAG: heat shock factor binding protein 1 [Caudovirales sp. ctOwN3]|nr:MAG: heat shock factor binding protein 1 [Caudovirales sp. ctOwN3]
MSDKDIDLVQYGMIISKVDLMEKKIDALEQDIKQLLELANKSKGGFWMGMAITSGISGFVGFLASIFFHK